MKRIMFGTTFYGVYGDIIGHLIEIIIVSDEGISSDCHLISEIVDYLFCYIKTLN